VIVGLWDFVSDLQRFGVGGFNHLEEYESMGRMTSHILWKIKKCLKPPTSSSHMAKNPIGRM